MEPTFQSNKSYWENAKDLWVDIKERFLVVNGPRINPKTEV
jgi:hypothetical protein